jgi:uncharacterized protein (TIGR03067 family)
VRGVCPNGLCWLQSHDAKKPASDALSLAGMVYHMSDEGVSMQKLLASIVCFSLCAVMATAQGDKEKGKKIEGIWTATSGSFNGKKVPDEAIAKIMATITFKEGKYTSAVLGNVDEAGTYTIDAKKKPVQIDLMITEGKDKGKTQVGLVKIDGDTMTFAVSKAGIKDRPKDFEGGDDIAVLVLKRGK